MRGKTKWKSLHAVLLVILEQYFLSIDLRADQGPLPSEDGILLTYRNQNPSLQCVLEGEWSLDPLARCNVALVGGTLTR
ncbi:hypothetical protein EDC04DRAFT_2819395 [Pisolithus marmoratus]|nr:hypothetical protein EDC04DRAFT_2819395 [Pisolithus marmoratus]